MKPQELYAEIRRTQKPTKIVKIDGVGTGKVYGTLCAETIVKRLLECDAITGG